MKIGILGSGDVGKALQKGFSEFGYEVDVGSRNPDNGKPYSEVAAFADLLVLAVKGDAAKDTLSSAGDLSGKIIIDACNPIEGPPENGVIKFFTSADDSLMQQLQKAFPTAKFVKAFNSIGASHMVKPRFEATPTMFICGDDANAKKEVSKIVEQFGFDVEDMGGVNSAGAIEGLCILWCIPGFLRNEWRHAFKLLKK